MKNYCTIVLKFLCCIIFCEHNLLIHAQKDGYSHKSYHSTKTQALLPLPYKKINKHKTSTSFYTPIEDHRAPSSSLKLHKKTPSVKSNSIHSAPLSLKRMSSLPTTNTWDESNNPPPIQRMSAYNLTHPETTISEPGPIGNSVPLLVMVLLLLIDTRYRHKY